MNNYLIDIAVINSNHLTVSMYHIRSNWNTEYIERFIRLKGHRLSECNWGVFKEEVDERKYDL
jgi:hypothetical protein